VKRSPTMPVEPLDNEARPDGLTARRRERTLALEAFRAAMSEAPGRLEALHQALEKSQGAKVIRGGWQSDEAEARRSGPSYAACPLNILFADEKREVEATMRASEEALARHGFTSADFYRAWDAGLIGVRELLRIVDQTLTAALMGGRDLPGR
jgi:hypothetical protein